MSGSRFHPRRGAVAYLRKVSLLRVVVLALLLISANAIAAWTMSVSVSANTTATTSPHHCDESDAAPSSKSAHGNTCVCCHDGCLCMHACGAMVPELLALRSLAPDSALPVRHPPTPPAPPGAELLRPPTA